MVTAFYLDTSVAVHALAGTRAAVRWFEDTTGSEDQALLSSRILQTEITRVLRREHRAVVDRRRVLDYVDLVEIDETTLLAAETIGEHVKTLDAIHLATAMAIGADTVVVTHDRAMARVAATLGLAAFDPIGG